MEDTSQRKRERSIAYPSLSLAKAIEFSLELRTKLGKGPYGREEAALALGHKGLSGASATKIATLTHFGLLTRYGNTYSQSELAERINHPLTDDDRYTAIVEVSKNPRLYKDLIGQFAGQALPTQLDNILVRKGISAKVASTVAQDFRSSLEYSGLLKNGVILPEGGDPFFTADNSPKSVDTKYINKSENKIATADEKISFSFTDSGPGWILSIKSEKPITSKIKKALIDALDLFEEDK